MYGRSLKSIKAMKSKVYFVGVDDWNRPVFREIGTRRFFCDTDNLVSYDAKESDVIDKYKAIGTDTICYKGSSFDAEPMGDPADVEILAKVEVEKLLRPEVDRAWARDIILNFEPSLTREMVNKYTDSELKEWMNLLKIKTSF